MDFRDNEYDRTDGRYSGNRNLYCDLCFRRCRGIYHVIEKGDTLYSLGKRYHVSVSDLMRANPYVNVYNLRIGEELCIPVRPQPRTDMGESWETYPSNPPSAMPVQPESRPVPAKEAQQERMPEERQENMGMPGMGNERQDNWQIPGMERVSEEEVQAESRQSTENQFSENDSIKEVLERTGLSMSDFMKFLAEKTD